MTVHLVKLCVGADSIEDLVDWQAKHRRAKSKGGKSCAYHTTFQWPKREADLLDGGSLYWVIKGVILVRQAIVGLEEGTKEDGSRCCVLMLDPKLVPVRPMPRKAFQGWRYLDRTEAPSDLKRGAKSQFAEMPAHLRKKLADLGLV